MIDLSDSWFKGILTTVMGAFMGLLTWNSRRLVGKLDKAEENIIRLDKEKADKVDYKELKQLMQDGFKNVQNRIDGLYKK